MTKRIKSLVLAFIMVVGFATYALSVNAAEPNTDTAVPLYNNTSSYSTIFTISDTGLGTIGISCRGYSGTTTKIEVHTYVQLKIGSSWITIKNGASNNVWVDTVSGYRLDTSHSIQLDSGTYKVVALYYVYGSGGDTDVISTSVTKTYTKS